MSDYPPSSPLPPYYPPQPRPAWPVVIGVISIVWASLGLICTPVSLAVNFVAPMRHRPLEFFPHWYRLFLIPSALVAIGMAVLLLAAGVQAIRRRPAGATLHLIYAVLGMVITVLSTVVNISLLAGLHLPGHVGQKSITGVVAVGSVFGGALALAYPVFLLIWFARPTIRHEVRQWGRHQAG